MKNKTKVIATSLLGFCLGLIVGDWKLQAQDDNNLRPKIMRSQDNGWKHYQRVVLDNASLQFGENGKTLSCHSDFVDYDFSKNEKNQLTNFGLHLRSNSERGFRIEPGAGTGEWLSNSTFYQDLNGDSVLDTMIKHGPQGHGSYILYKNTWVEVGSSKIGFSKDRGCTSVETKTKYVFTQNGWDLAK